MKSIIRWRTSGAPHEGDTCLVLMASGVVSMDYWEEEGWMIANGEKVVGWCKTDDIEHEHKKEEQV